MNSAREAEVLAHIPTLDSTAEAAAFRKQLSDQGETLTTEVYRALIARLDYLRGRDGK